MTDSFPTRRASELGIWNRWAYPKAGAAASGDSTTRLVAQFHGWLRMTCRRTFGHRFAHKRARSMLLPKLSASSKLLIGSAPSRSSAFEQMETSVVMSAFRSEEHTSELQSLMRISYAVFCLKKKTINNTNNS